MSEFIRTEEIGETSFIHITLWSPYDGLRKITSEQSCSSDKTQIKTTIHQKYRQAGNDNYRNKMKKYYLSDFLGETRLVSCHSIFNYISYKDFFSYLSGSVFIAGLWWSHLSTEPCPSPQREAYSFWFTAVSSSKTLEVHNFLKLFYLLEFLENILSCRNPP